MTNLSAKDVTRLEELELALSRKRTEASHEKKRADKHYEELRRLENAVREAVRASLRAPDGDAAQDAVEPLLRRIPVKPRPTLTELRKRSYKLHRRLTR